jgi:hypothetical protein
MQTIKSITFILLITLLFLSCNQQDKLIGKWERFGDQFKGMTIQIKNEGGSFKAEIIETTDAIELNGFVKGDIKWKDIKNISENKYEYQDLGKKPILYSDKFEGDYVMARLEFVSDTLLQTRVFSKGDELIGTETQWRKISNEK